MQPGRFPSIRSTYLWWWSIALVLLLGLVGSAAAEQHQTATYRSAYDRAIAIGKQVGYENVLFVSDIDNTLLAMNQSLGSNQWFDWQSELQKDEPQSPLLVSPEFSGLLEAQRLLFSVSGMHLPEAEISGWIADLQKRGVTVIAHTSRGFEARDATRRELRRNGLNLAARPIPLKLPPSNPYLPYPPGKPASGGVTVAEARQFKLPEQSRPVSYAEGVYMTAGQHKGGMLRMLLAGSPRRFKALVFIDDGSTNTDNVFAAFKDTNIQVDTYRYSREDGEVARFNASDKTLVDRKWRRLAGLLHAGYPGNPLESALTAAPGGAAESNGQPAHTLKLGTLNCEFLIRSRVHLKFGLPFDPRDFSATQKAQWNANGFRDARMRDAVKVVAQVIAGMNADVLGLTEVGDRRDVQQLVEELSRLGVAYRHVAVCRSRDTFTQQHVAVLSKLPLENVLPALPGIEGFDREPDDVLSEDDTDVSKAMRVTVRWNGRPVHVYVAHFTSERGGHEKDAQRIAQASLVRRHYLPHLNAGGHVVVMGDLNDHRGQPAIRRVRGRDDIWGDLVQTGSPTFNRRKGNESTAQYNARLRQHWTYEFLGQRRQIDHVLISQSLVDASERDAVTIQFVPINKTLGNRPATDHRGVLLGLPPRQAANH